MAYTNTPYDLSPSATQGFQDGNALVNENFEYIAANYINGYTSTYIDSNFHTKTYIDDNFQYIAPRESSAAVPDNSWVTIAEFTGGRAHGEFVVYDSNSSKHNLVRIVASSSYGRSVISCIGGIAYSTITIRHVRMLYNTSDKVYGGAKLQIYIGSGCHLRVYAMLTNKLTDWTGWNVISPSVQDLTDWTEDSGTRVNDITSTSGRAFAGDGSGLTSLNASNLSSGTVPDARLPTPATRWPAWGEVTSKPSTFSPSSHTHSWNEVLGSSREVSGDWNDVIETGFYQGSGLLNESPGSSWRFCIVQRHKDSWISQTMMPFDGGEIYQRNKISGTWSAWKQVLYTDGDGSGLTSLNASNLSSGIISDARLPNSITGKTITGSTGLVLTNGEWGAIRQGAYTDSRGNTSNAQDMSIWTRFFASGGSKDINTVFRDAGGFTCYGPDTVGEIASLTSSGNLSVIGNVTANEFIETSSIHLKKNIRDLGKCLDKVTQLKPKIYDRKDGSSNNEVGLIAQDVQAVFPELSDGETVKYTRLTVYLINAVKELTERVEILEQEIENGRS